MMLLANVILNTLSITGITLLAYFVWTFPSRSRLPAYRGLQAAIVGGGATAALISMLDNAGVITFALPGNHTQISFNLLLAVCILAGLVWQLRRAEGVIARRQARALLAGVVLGFGLAIGGSVAPQLLGINSILAFTIFFPAPGLLPLAFALAVLRYRLFDADGLAPKAAVYAVVVVTSGAAYVAVMAGVEAAFAAQSNEHAAAGRWVGFLVVLAIGEPLRAIGKRVLDRWLARDRRAFIGRCSRLAAKVASVSDTRVIEMLARETLDARDARVFDLRETSPHETLAAVQRRLAESGAQRVVEIRDPGVVDALLALAIDVVVAIPGRVPRALGLTLSLAPNLLDASVRDALGNVGRVIGTALDRDEERAGFASKLRHADEERAQIAMELHDGTGATLAAARLLAQLARATYETRGDALGALAALDRTLEDGLVDMRSTLWTLDQQHGTWEALAAQVRRHAGDVCAGARLELAMTSDDGNGHAPTARVRLALFRIVQEALNNVVRHAGAAHVKCDLTTSTAGFELVFEDDGVGLPAAPCGEGRGLRNMQSRVESIGGRISFARPDSGGTRIVAHIPVAARVRA
jgi:signal transduction histidine kinase